MKWFGQIGFEYDELVEPGVHEPKIVVRDYFGDLLKTNWRNDSSNIVTDFNISNQLSILSDPFILENLHKIVFVTFMNAKWRVSSVDIQYPRLTLTIGELYKDEDNESEDEEG